MENGQKQINKQNEKDIVKLYSHADIANREMGEIKTDIKWVKRSLTKLESRVWWILGVLIMGMLAQISVSLLT